MKPLQLTSQFPGNMTLIENEFIDRHMVRANGEYVKVYLFLLRHLGRPDVPVSISCLADALDNTEKDILRALNYWGKEGLLTLQMDEHRELCGLCLKQIGSARPVQDEAAASSDNSEEQSDVPEPAPVSSRPKVPQASGHTPSAQERQEMKQVLFVTEQYIGRTLTKTEVENIFYFYDALGFAPDLIEYLIEYCVDNGHKSFHYIQKVALAWYEEQVTTIDRAREHTTRHNKNCYSILNAFGITGRNPASVELDYIRRWFNEYGFTLELILEACNRTISNIHQPSFEYADSILKSWSAGNVHHMSDLEKADKDFQQKKDAKKTPVPAPKQAGTNRFNNFQGRTYDIDSLEQQLLNSH